MIANKQELIQILKACEICGVPGETVVLFGDYIGHLCTYHVNLFSLFCKKTPEYTEHVKKEIRLKTIELLKLNGSHEQEVEKLLTEQAEICNNFFVTTEKWVNDQKVPQ